MLGARMCWLVILVSVRQRDFLNLTRWLLLPSDAVGLYWNSIVDCDMSLFSCWMSGCGWSVNLMPDLDIDSSSIHNTLCHTQTQSLPVLGCCCHVFWESGWMDCDRHIAFSGNSHSTKDKCSALHKLASPSRFLSYLLITCVVHTAVDLL